MTSPTPTDPKPTNGASAQAEPALPADVTIRWVLLAIAVVGLLLAVGAAIGWGWRFALGVGIGAAIAVANLAVFQLVVRGLLGEGRYRRVWILVAIVKLVALFGGLYLLLRGGVASGLSLVIGYGSLPLGITVGGLIAPRPEDGAPRR